MIKCLCSIQNPHLFIAWCTFCNVSVSHAFGVLIDRSSIPPSIFVDGVLVARAATYNGVNYAE